MIEELQRTVITLSRENKELNDRNEGLRRELIDIGSKYPSVVPLHAVMTGVPGPGPSAGANFDPNTPVASPPPGTPFPGFFAGMRQAGAGMWPTPTANTPPAVSSAQQAA